MAERSRFQLSLSPQGATALRILKDSEIPLCGLDVVAASGGTIVKGSVWYILQKLESQMLVVSEKEIDENVAIPKRLYRVTEEGVLLLDIYERLEKLATTAI